VTILSRIDLPAIFPGGRGREKLFYVFSQWGVWVIDVEKYGYK